MQSTEIEYCIGCIQYSPKVLPALRRNCAYVTAIAVPQTQLRLEQPQLRLVTTAAIAPQWWLNKIAVRPNTIAFGLNGIAVRANCG